MLFGELEQELAGAFDLFLDPAYRKIRASSRLTTTRSWKALLSSCCSSRASSRSSSG